MSVTLIAAKDVNGCIGNGLKLPWGKPLPADMAWFRKHTLEKSVVMGRKTWDSIGGKPLLRRKANIVLTRDTGFSAPGATVCSDIQQVLDLSKEEEIIVIGGAEMYRMFLPYADKMLLTIVQARFEGDIYFPFFDRREFALHQHGVVSASEVNPHALSFVTYERVKNFRRTA